MYVGQLHTDPILSLIQFPMCFNGEGLSPFELFELAFGDLARLFWLTPTVTSPDLLRVILNGGLTSVCLSGEDWPSMGFSASSLERRPRVATLVMVVTWVAETALWLVDEVVTSWDEFLASSFSWRRAAYCWTHKTVYWWGPE